MGNAKFIIGFVLIILISCGGPPATASILDPNGDEGNDNGYLGHGADSFPVPLATFHLTKKDALSGVNAISMTHFDEKGYRRVFLRVYPDDKGIYHSGDNYLVEIKFYDTLGQEHKFERELACWKKLRIECDYFEGCLPEDTTCWWVVKRIYRGEDLTQSPSPDPNRNPYIRFEPSHYLYLLIDDEIPDTY